MSNVTIMILIKKIGEEGGGKASALELAETLQQLDYRVYIGLTNEYSLIYKLKHIKDKNTIIPFSRIYTVAKDIERQVETRRDPGKGNYLLYRIKKIIKHIMTVNEYRQGKFYSALNNADLIIDASDLSDQGFKQLRSRAGGPVVLNHNGSPEAFENFFLSSNYKDKTHHDKKELYNDYLKRYDGLLFQAADQAKECQERNPDLQIPAYVVMPTCRELDVLAGRQKPTPYRDGRLALVCVGSIQPRKGQHKALAVFEKIAGKHENVDLHFVGGIHSKGREYYNELKQLARSSVFEERIFFHGFRKDWLRFMAHANVLIQVSEAEGVSRILREAMLLKLPVVSFDISGTKSLLSKGKDAFLVEYDDLDAFADAVNRCLEDPALARAMGKAAFQKYLLNNSKAAYAANLIKVVENLVLKKEVTINE